MGKNPYWPGKTKNTVDLAMLGSFCVLQCTMKLVR